MRKIIANILVMGLLAGTLAGCKSGNAVPVQSTEAYTIQISTALNDTDPLVKGLHHMAEELEKRSEGRIKAEIMTSGLLGDTADVLEQVRMGVNVGVIVDAGRFADYIPEMMIFEGPYLFDDYQQAAKFTQSDMFKDWMKEVENQGIHVAAWNYYQGARHMWTQKEVKTPADLAGVKIRTGTSPMWQSIVESFGAKPVNIAGNETYQSIQQKVCDGMEGQISGGYSLKCYEVTKYLTKTSHFQLLTGLVVSNAWYQSLPDDLKVIFDEVCTEGGVYASEMTIDQETEIEEKMKAEGLVIVTPDLAEYQKISDAVYDKFEGFRELKEKIQAEVKE